MLKLVRTLHSPFTLRYPPMLRSLRHYLLTGENRLNTYATVMLLLVFGIFQWNTDPEACGGDPIAATRRRSPQLLVSMVTPVPVDASATAPIRLAVDEVIKPVASGAESEQQPLATASDDIKSPEGAVLTGREAIISSRHILTRGLENLKKTTDYVATFKRQERINGSLLDPQAMNLKVRHEPFSLYMKWTEGDKGRQLIYVQGQNEDNVLVQIGGVAGRLTGALAMAPDDPRVLAESRYPATCAGLLELTKIIINHHESDVKRESGVVCEMRDGESFDSRPCYQTSLTYETPSINPDYHKSLILIDKELSVPVCVRNYTWVEGKPSPTDGEDNLIEAYSYSGIEIGTQLSDSDFEKSKYRMR